LVSLKKKLDSYQLILCDCNEGILLMGFKLVSAFYYLPIIRKLILPKNNGCYGLALGGLQYFLFKIQLQTRSIPAHNTGRPQFTALFTSAAPRNPPRGPPAHNSQSKALQPWLVAKPRSSHRAPTGPPAGSEAPHLQILIVNSTVNQNLPVLRTKTKRVCN